jgi:uncharacterized protein YjbI with pentapeptide repeats
MFRKLMNKVPLPKDMLLKMLKQDNRSALTALRQLQDRGFIGEGLFKGIDLSHAQLHLGTFAQVDMENAVLDHADLRKSYFYKTNLRGASLQHCKLRSANMGDVFLQGADLSHADLSHAHLPVANLHQARLIKANLQEVNLWQARLPGADLTGANLRGANIAGLACDAETVLPDGSHWHESTDLTRFTDPNHPNFWQAG